MRVAIVLPFYGPWNSWFPFYLSTCRYLGPEIEVLILTDNDVPVEASSIPNVRFLPITLEEINTRVAGLTGVTPGLHRGNPHKVCDYRPMFGKLFERELAGYDFWAYGDEDVFYGNLLRFIDRRYFRDCDVIAAVRQSATFGPLTFVRNTPLLRDLFLRECRTLRRCVETDVWVGHDEGFPRAEDTFGAIVMRTPEVRRVSLPLVADDLYYGGDFNDSWDYEACVHADHSRVRTNWALHWEKGRLLHLACEIPFFHFIKSKIRQLNPGFRESFEGRRGLVESFYCSHKGLIERSDYEQGLKKPSLEPAPSPGRPRFPLHRPGSCDFIDYEDYGTFFDRDSIYYRYELKAPEALAEALGEGILDGASWVRDHPLYQGLQRQGRLAQNHWAHVGTGNPLLAYFCWAEAPEAPAVKLYFTAEALLRAGHLVHALKAYQAITVLYPNHYAWDPNAKSAWYVGPAALEAIERICAEHPELRVRFEGGKVQIHNPAPALNDPQRVTNERDIVIVNPGRFRRTDGARQARGARPAAAFAGQPGRR